MIMTTRRDEVAAFEAEGVPNAERRAWCGDCRADSLFEAVVEEGRPAGRVAWACTVCGAAYFDVIDVTEDAPVVTRGVA